MIREVERSSLSHTVNPRQSQDSCFLVQCCAIMHASQASAPRLGEFQVGVLKEEAGLG